MKPKGANKEGILEALEMLGGVTASNIRALSRRTGVPEAEIYGTATFYHLIEPVQRRVCTSLSCKIQQSDEILAKLRSDGLGAQPVSCLGQCDRPVAMLDEHHQPIIPNTPTHLTEDNPDLAFNLAGTDSLDYAALAKFRTMGVEAFLEQLDASGLQGRGGAGFPAAFKWKSVRSQKVQERYVVCNADEAEPGTFKDREIMLQRPHLMLEGLAIAAETVGARDIYVYVRGAYGPCKARLEAAMLEASQTLSEWNFHFVSGHGAYICGEETALLESLEGQRGMPRLKPPYPTQEGFRGKPTLVHNVETLAAVPAIILRGGEWFKAQGRNEAGPKLYCISGHIARPGVYELALGATLDELVEAAGGYIGTPMAFSPGGASSGFLPMTYRDTPLDFRSLTDAGSMLGSAGVVVLNDTTDIVAATRNQAQFFEDESCGQCAPCRIGTRVVRRALDRFIDSGNPADLSNLEDIAWEMEEGSICGLGIAAAIPLMTAMKHFPESFRQRGEA